MIRFLYKTQNIVIDSNEFTISGIRQMDTKQEQIPIIRLYLIIKTAIFNVTISW